MFFFNVYKTITKGFEVPPQRCET